MLVTACYLSISNYFEKKNNSKNKENIIETVIEPDVVTNTYEERILPMENPYVIYNVKYPYFKNADESFNSSVETLLKNKMEEHANVSKDGWEAHYNTQIKGDNIPKVPNENQKFNFYSDYRIIQSNSSYISYVLTYGGFSGGAHGYEIEVSFNYDVKNQKVLTLKDMFPNNSDYLNYLSEQSRNILKGKYAVVSEEDKSSFENPDQIKEYEDNAMNSINLGTDPKEENFSVFTFIKDRITIYFAEYQVGPYVIGMPEVEIDIK